MNAGMSGPTVYVDSLRDFAASLAEQLKLDFQPAVEPYVLLLETTTLRFGSDSASDEVHIAVANVREAYRLGAANMRHHLERVDALVDKVHQMIGNYEYADQAATDFVTRQGIESQVARGNDGLERL